MDRDTTLKSAAELVAKNAELSNQLQDLAVYGNQLMRLIAERNKEQLKELSYKYDQLLKDCKANIKQTDKAMEQFLVDLDIPTSGDDIADLSAILITLHITDEEARQYHLIRG